MPVPFPTTAIVLAAGLGTRMRPLTLTMPKPLVPVAGKALLDHTLDYLASSGVTRAVVNIAYLGAQIRRHLQGRAHPTIEISDEGDHPLETGGGIAKALPLLGDAPFFSLNADAILRDRTRPALAALAAHFDPEHMDALLLLQPVERAVGYHGAGDFSLSETGALTRRGAQPSAPYVFTGVQLLHPRLFATAPEGSFSLNLLYNRDMDATGTLPRIHGLVHEGDWLEVGDKEGLAAAEAFFKV